MQGKWNLNNTINCGKYSWSHYYWVSGPVDQPAFCTSRWALRTELEWAWDVKKHLWATIATKVSCNSHLLALLPDVQVYCSVKEVLLLLLIQSIWNDSGLLTFILTQPSYEGRIALLFMHDSMRRQLTVMTVQLAHQAMQPVGVRPTWWTMTMQWKITLSAATERQRCERVALYHVYTLWMKQRVVDHPTARDHKIPKHHCMKCQWIIDNCEQVNCMPRLSGISHTVQFSLQISSVVAGEQDIALETHHGV